MMPTLDHEPETKKRDRAQPETPTEWVQAAKRLERTFRTAAQKAQGGSDPVVQTLERGLAKFPDNLFLLNLLCKALIKDGEFERAEPLCMKIIALDGGPTCRNLTLLGHLYQSWAAASEKGSQNQRYGLALGCFAKAIKLDHLDGYARKRHEEVKRVTGRAPALQDLQAAQKKLAKVLPGEHKKWKKPPGDSATPEEFAVWVQSIRLKARPSDLSFIMEVIDVLKQAAKSHPDSPALLCQLGYKYTQAASVAPDPEEKDRLADKGLDYFEEAYEYCPQEHNNPLTQDILRGMAHLLKDAGYYKEAEETLADIAHSEALRHDMIIQIPTRRDFAALYQAWSVADKKAGQTHQAEHHLQLALYHLGVIETNVFRADDTANIYGVAQRRSRTIRREHQNLQPATQETAENAIAAALARLDDNDKPQHNGPEPCTP